MSELLRRYSKRELRKSQLRSPLVYRLGMPVAVVQRNEHVPIRPDFVPDSNWASCSWLSTGSCTWFVFNPLPMILTDVPIGTATMIWTGSGKIGPRTTTLGLSRPESFGVRLL